MSFRNDDDARRHRIDALESDLEEKDAEIARLKTALEAKESAPKSKKSAPRSVATKAAQVPGGDVWKLDTHDKRSWMFGVGWLVVLAAILGYLHRTGSVGAEEGLWVVCFGIPGLFFFARSGLVLDRSAGTVTRWRAFFFAKWRRTVPLAGRAIEIEKRLASPEEGSSYWAGRVYLGDLKLFAKKEEDAERLAQQIAAYLGVPCRVKHPSAKQANRALIPLLAVMGAGLAFAAYMLWARLR